MFSWYFRHNNSDRKAIAEDIPAGIRKTDVQSLLRKIKAHPTYEYCRFPLMISAHNDDPSERWYNFSN